MRARCVFYACCLAVTECSAPLPTESAPVIVPLRVSDGILPAGARVTARLAQPIGTARKLGGGRTADVTRPGQRFAAVLAVPIVDRSGHVRARPGAIVEGRLAEAQPGDALHPARLSLDVESLCDEPLRARVIVPVPDQIEVDARERTLEGATFAWLLMGTLMFGMPGFMLGSTVGSASGTAARARGRVVEGFLPAGTSIVIVLDAPAALGSRC